VSSLSSASQRLAGLARSPRRATGDDGFTMAETIVSITLLAFVAAAATTAVITSGHAQSGGQTRTSAANLARNDLDKARALVYPDYPAAVAAHPEVVGSMTFTVSRTVTALYASQAAAPAGSTCPVNLTGDGVLSLRVVTTVAWTEKGKPLSTSVSEVLAC
jgi:prepilin-type N-terminal cleavage/methylation domain-containing protein